MMINLRSGAFSDSGQNLVYKSNIDNTVYSIKLNEIECVLFSENKILLHREFVYGFRFAFIGFTIIVIGTIILYSVYSGGYYATDIIGVILLIGAIPLFFGTLILITSICEAFFGVDLHSKLLLRFLGKKMGLLTLITNGNHNNISLYTYPDEAMHVDQLIKFIEELKQNEKTGSKH